MSSKKNEITEGFKRKLAGLLPELSRNNHYIAFLHDRITCELQIQLKGIKDHDVVNMKNEAEPNLANHPFPLSDERIQFMPMFTDPNDPVYKTDMDELLNWASKNRDPVTFFEMTKDYYSQKKSWVVQKILSLSEDFIKKLDEISNETGIPLLSLHNMYVLMTGVNDFFQSEQKEVLLRPFLQYPVSVLVSPDQRDDLIIGVWNRIYNLLVECYWVVIVVGMIDFLNIVGDYKEEGLEEAQNYLMHSVIYSELERRVLLIKDVDELRSYLHNEFSIFECCFPDFSQFVKMSVVPIVKKRKKVLDFPITPLTDHIFKKAHKGVPAFEPEPDDEPINPLDEELNIPSEDPDSDDESLSQGDSGDSGDSCADGTDGDQQDQKESLRKIPILEEFTVIDGVEKKMEDFGLLNTYRLTGNPDKMIHYLFKIISNVSLTITDQIYSQELDKRYDISSSTWRRWRRKIREGEIQLPDHPDRPSGIRSINDLFEPEIRKIMIEELNKKEHHKENYFTQNQLIEKLRNDEMRIGLQKRGGIRLNKYSRTSLRNMLNKLMKESRIPFEKIGVANYSKESDFLQIAREIAQLQASKKVKK
jgi:hypothetical protein